MVEMYSPERRLYGVPGAEYLQSTLQEAFTHNYGGLWTDDDAEDGLAFQIEEWTVRDHRSHFGKAEWLVEMVEEWADEITEVIDFDRTPEQIAAAEHLIHLVAEGMMGWMAENLVATHIIRREGGKWMVDGEPLYPEVAEA